MNAIFLYVKLFNCSLIYRYLLFKLQSYYVFTYFK